MMLSLLLPLFTTLSLQTAPPVPASRDVPALLSAAEQKLSALDDEAARDLVLPLVEDPTVPREQRARAALVLGLAEANLLHPPQAQAAFKRALGDNPSVALPADASPKAQELFRAAQMELVQASVAKPAPLPEKVKPEMRPVLGWVRPTSILLMTSGGLLMGAGTVVAIGATAVRLLLPRFVGTHEQADFSRWLLPLALVAGFLLVMAVPVGGLGLALFFLSGEDGPLGPHVPTEQEP